MPTPLHNHTHNSQLDGLSTPEEIAERCQECGYEAVAVTDHDVVAGHIDFYKKIDGVGIKPLLGVETYQTIESRYTNNGALSKRDEEGNKNRVDNFHLILIAINNTGLKNLWTMNSEAHTTGFYYNGRVDWELLRKYNEGIICTSACGLGMVSQALKDNPYLPDVHVLVDKYLDIFGDRFYIELSTYSEDWQRNLNYQLASLADEHGIPMVYANDAHYAFSNQYELHETVLCMQYQEKKGELESPHHTPDLYIMDEKEINNAFYYLPQAIVDEAIDNSDSIASLCSVSLPEHRMRVPVFVPDSGWSTSRDMIFDLARQGYEEKISSRGLPDDIYMERFKKEIKVIFDANLYDYLLMVRDFIMWAKNQGILVGPGRGSIGGSLIAYLIGIHEIDPIRYGLIFERFFNVGRVGSLPDIDVDFPTWAREKVKTYLLEKYGEDYCSDIGTVSTLQGRAAIQKLGSTLGIPFVDTKNISKIIEKTIESGQQPKWVGKNGIWEKAGKELAPYKSKHPQLFDYAESMYGRTFTYGVHASGFLISDEPLKSSFPLRWNTKEKKPVTQWDMRIAEELGFMKHDILGLRNLDTLMAYNEVLKDQGKPTVQFYDVIQMDEEGQLPEEMWEELDNGNTVGIFQIEDAAFVKGITKKIKPRNLEELALITALNRPGPMKSGAVERYIDGRNGNPHPALHPIVSKIAKESHGEIIYQEQLINFFIELGYDPLEADNVRKITGKKKRDEMQKLRADYEKRFKEHGANDVTIEKVWKIVEGFADYAFNKAHSVEYGTISLWTLYAKWLNPVEFYLASIKSLVAEGKKKEVPRYIHEARHNKIEVLPVDMNESDVQTTIQNGAIRYGLQDVKGIGADAARWLIANRPFKSFDDIIERAEDPANKITLRSGIRKMAVNRGHVEKLKMLTTTEGEILLEAQEELLGYALSDESATILDEYSEEIEAHCESFDALEKPGRHIIAGIITNIKETKTRKGSPMAWVTIENGSDSADFTVWDSELTRLSFIWRRRQAVIATVKVNDRGMNIESAKALYPKDKK